jgi:hypothetical protein
MAESPLFRDLEQVSEQDLGNIPPFRAKGHFGKFAKSRGASSNLTLLTSPFSNAKILKNQTSPNPLARLSAQFTMNLAPAGTSGVTDVCGSCSTPGCRANCLSDSGHMSGEAPQRAQRIRTEYATEHPDMFLAQLRDETRAGAEESWGNELHPVFRYNTLSDTAFKRLPTSPTLIGDYVKKPSGIAVPRDFAGLPGATFSDYSKENMRGPLGKPSPKEPYPNVSTAHSASELTSAARVREVLGEGKNVIFPVDKSKKEAPHPYTTFTDKSGDSVTAKSFDSDRDDARWADPEEGQFGILSEKKQGAFAGKDATGKPNVINPHTNDAGFIRPNTEGTRIRAIISSTPQGESMPIGKPVRMRNHMSGQQFGESE